MSGKTDGMRPSAATGKVTVFNRYGSNITKRDGMSDEEYPSPIVLTYSI